MVALQPDINCHRPSARRLRVEARTGAGKEVIIVSLLGRWLITAIALFVAAVLVPGIRVQGPAWLVYGGMAVVLSLVNAFLRPILKLLSCPFIILSLGFFLLIINAVTLWLSSAVCVALGIQYRIESFGAAFVGALIVSVVSFVLSLMAREE